MVAILFAVIAVAFTAPPLFAGDAPAIYKKCKMCHGDAGSGKGKSGPDLAKSSWTLEQWTQIVELGRKGYADGPAQMAEYENKKMMKQKEVTADDVKAIFDYVHSVK